MEQIMDNSNAQMRKGILDYITLLVISRGPVYATDILNELSQYQLIVVEGTIYPLLSRLKNSGFLEYAWKESSSGPPRKYYSLTPKGKEMLDKLSDTWKELNRSVNKLIKTN